MMTPGRHSFRSLVGAGFRLAVACLLLWHGATSTGFAAGDDHDHEHPEGKPVGKGKPPEGRNRVGEAPRRNADEGCPVSPAGLAEFANGERYDYGNLVTFLSMPGCSASSRQISLAALAQGVTFNNKPPFRLDAYASAYAKVDLESAKRIEQNLATSFPALLRANPLSAAELLPLLGQVSLLSPRAGLSTLNTIIQQELYAGDGRLASSSFQERELAAADLARTLVRLGAADGLIASEMAEGVEEMALLTQADSLAKYFRALSAAATVDAALVPTFNLSAGALNRGVQRSKTELSPAERAGMLTALFTAVRSSVNGSGSLEPGAAELNEALGALLDNEALTATKLKRLWKEAVKVLTQSPSQTALADAVALSLTPEFIYLQPDSLEQILLAAKSYPSIAGALQRNFLKAWRRAWDDVHDRRMKLKAFNRLRDKYFEPMTAELLDLDPYLIDPHWLAEVTRRNLVQDEDIEKRFPRFVLAYLDRREKAARIAATESGAEPLLNSMAENFAVVWTLSTVHVPALMKWVKKYEQ